ncbi:MAG: TonB-dependent receptor [Paenacidovorax caeni]
MNPACTKKPKSLRLVNGMAAAGLSSAVLLPLGAMAQSATPVTTLPTVTVQEQAIDPNPNAEVGAPYKAKTSADARHTRPLAETPQTISVVTKAAIDDSGLTDLKQILAAQPGITLGTGENGNAFGDRYIIRGQEARSDVFVDGLRDTGMTTRESFAIEQIEITKGPSSSFAGRGSAGGAINAVTKQATLDYDFTRVSAGIGTDGHHRVTMDANKGFGESFALRANALHAGEDVPERSPSARSRKGLALSGLWEVNKDLSVTLDYYGLRAKDTRPDLGAYLVGTPPNRIPAKGVPVYAQDNDFVQSDVDTVSARIAYRLAPNLKLTSLTRYGTSDNGYATTGASFNATAQRGAIDGGHTGWQDVKYFAHQDNLRWDAQLGGLKHEFIFGFEYTDHRVKSGNYKVTTNGTPNCITNATATANNGFCITDANGVPLPNLGGLSGRTYDRNAMGRDWHVKALALSIMDTVDLTDKWTVFGGLRADRTDLSLSTYNAATGAQTADYGYKDTLLNGHLGVSYKINPMGMVYASYSSAQDINGGESDVGTSSRLRRPGRGHQWQRQRQARAVAELRDRHPMEPAGRQKAPLFTAAAFRTTKKDVMEAAPSGTGYELMHVQHRQEPRAGHRVRPGRQRDARAAIAGGRGLHEVKVLDSGECSQRGQPAVQLRQTAPSPSGQVPVHARLRPGRGGPLRRRQCGGQPDTGAGYNAQELLRTARTPLQRVRPVCHLPHQQDGRTAPERAERDQPETTTPPCTAQALSTRVTPAPCA